jgi:hypothetical protein
LGSVAQKSYFENVKLCEFVSGTYVLENVKSVEVITLGSGFEGGIYYINMQKGELVYESKLYSLT